MGGRDEGHVFVVMGGVVGANIVGANNHLPLRVIHLHLAAHQFGKQGVTEGF
jgi:hypothetical protein